MQKFDFKVGIKIASSLKIFKFPDFSRKLDKMLKFPDVPLNFWSNIKFPDFSRLRSNPVISLLIDFKEKRLYNSATFILIIFLMDT